MINKQILGISGLARSGKSEVIQHVVQEHGFVRVGASDIIGAELERLTGRSSFSREEYRMMGDELRHKNGADFVVRAGLAMSHDKIVFDGIRNLAAQRTLYENGGTMIGLVALPSVRFERGLGNSEKIGPDSVEQMLEEEAPELNSIQPNGLNLLPVLWRIPPSSIIDTSHMTISEVASAVDAIIANAQWVV